MSLTFTGIAKLRNDHSCVESLPTLIDAGRLSQCARRRMLLALTRRRRARIITVAVVLVLLLLLRVTFPSFNIGFGTFLFPATRELLRFKASSVDWAAAKLFFLPNLQSTARLPRGELKTLPRVQASSELFKSTKETERRRAAVKDVFVRTWHAYKEQAWTWDELRPVSGGGKNAFGGWAATLVDSLDTLWIMGCVDLGSIRHMSITDFGISLQIA